MDRVTPTQLNSAMPTADDGGLLAPPELPAGLVEVELEAALDAVPLPVEFASGPVRKKFPARGLPRPSCSAKAEMLKLLIGVDELTMPGTSELKFAGCAKSRRMYLRRPNDHVV